jgi:DNA-binding IclR family transcriptional regulator
MPRSSQNGDDGLVRSLSHALLVLERLAEAGEPVSLHQLTGAVDLPKSTVHRLLTTMKARQFVTQDAGTGRYAVGPRAWVVGNHVPVIADLRQAAREPLARLRERTGEAVFVTALSDRTSMLVDFAGGLQAVTIARYGQPWSAAWATAAGRTALAYRRPPMSVSELQTSVPTGSALNGTDPVIRLAEIRSRGWESGPTGESLEIAAPVLDHTGGAVGAAGVIVPLLRGDPPAEDLIAAVVQAAEHISLTMGFLPQTGALPPVP